MTTGGVDPLKQLITEKSYAGSIQLQFFWTGAAGDDNFDNDANWLPLGVPGSTDDAVINLAVPTTITVTPETIVNSLSTSSSVTVALSDERFFLVGAATSAIQQAPATTWAPSS